jgi:hypothetical protein
VSSDLNSASVWLTLLVGFIGYDVRADEPQSRQAPAVEKISRRQPTQFIRILSDEFDSPVALQTATAKYVLLDATGKAKLEVSLEGVIHIADRGYFQGFNQRFQHYDSVLYELVAPPERRIPDATAPQAHPLAFLQRMAAEGLGLTHQVKQIDYKAQNLVHSDLSPAEMLLASKNRGDDPVTMIADTMLHWMRHSKRQLARPPDGTLQLDLSFLTEPNGTIELRRLLAKEFAKAGQLHTALPPNQRVSLIDDRNDRAMKVFQEQLDAGHRKIAFFWGAAHMENFEKRLMVEYGMEPAGVNWRNAWDLRDGAVERAPLESIVERAIRGALTEG